MFKPIEQTKNKTLYQLYNIHFNSKEIRLILSHMFNIKHNNTNTINYYYCYILNSMIDAFGMSSPPFPSRFLEVKYAMVKL